MSRPAALFLLWTHRRTVALWLRSLGAEFARGRADAHDPQRWKTLVSALWRVSRDSTLLLENELRRLVVADDDEHVVATLGSESLDSSAFVRSDVEPVIGYS
jgi:hypothetical protein